MSSHSMLSWTLYLRDEVNIVNYPRVGIKIEFGRRYQACPHLSTRMLFEFVIAHCEII
jgi:hypothetical protein